MDQDRLQGVASRRKWMARSAGMVSIAAGALAFGAASQAPVPATAAAIAEASTNQLPAPPANGVMGFVVHHFAPTVIQGKDACPDGPAMKNREIFLNTLSPDERERIQKKENEAEFNQRWRASLMHSDGSNICSQYSQFPERPLLRTVQSKFAWGLNLDGDEGDGRSNADGCAHENFTSPNGEKGIDNQAYRAMGCTLEWRGVSGDQGDIVRGLDGFLSSGEFTQVLLLRGVDSLVNDNDVEIIYGNTPDRPVVDNAGKFVWNASFTVSDKFPRERNVLHGKIVNGVLTTNAQDIKLTQTWGQSAQRDLRGIRSRWDLRKARLQLKFQPDGTLKGMVGAYQPIDHVGISPQLGGMGSAMVAGIDCAGEFNTIKKLADGLRDPKTGQCMGISTAIEMAAVPAFVNDAPGVQKQKVASR